MSGISPRKYVRAQCMLVSALTMKVAGCLLLISGWAIVLSAIALLRAATAEGAFVAAGIAVELLGLVVAARSHLADRGRKP